MRVEGKHLRELGLERFEASLRLLQPLPVVHEVEGLGDVCCIVWRQVPCRHSRSDFTQRVGFRVRGVGFRVYNGQRLPVLRNGLLTGFLPEDKGPYTFYPELIPTIGAFFSRGGPVQDPVLTPLVHENEGSRGGG